MKKHAFKEVLSFSNNIHFIKKSVDEMHEKVTKWECKKRGSRKKSHRKQNPQTQTLTLTLN